MKEYVKFFVLAFRNIFSKPIAIFCGVFIYYTLCVLYGRKAGVNYLRRLGEEALVFLLRLNGADIGKGSIVSSGVVFHNCKNFVNLRIGENCHIGKGCFFDLRDRVYIEDNVVVSMNVTILTHIDMSNSELGLMCPAESASVTIQKNSYIGAGSTILMGVNVGENH